MRQNKTLKICANHLVLPTMTLQEHQGNEKSCVWHAADFADGELKEETLCIRFPPWRIIDTCPGAKTINAGITSITEPSSFFIEPMSGEHSLERGNEGKDGSQFEQKMMSVMREGEMVQVSYKVYIPKKAPAPASRPLKR